MKNLFAVLLLFLLPVLSLADESCSQEFLSFAHDRYVNAGYSIFCTSERGDSAALIVKNSEKQTLVVCTRENGIWKELYENPVALQPQEGSWSVTLDTENTLILSFVPSSQDRQVVHQYYVLTDGDWLLTSVEGFDSIVNGVGWEYTAAVGNGRMGTGIRATDEDGNLIGDVSCPEDLTLPDVLTAEERSLRNIDNLTPPFTSEGYRTEENGNLPVDILRRIFEKTAPQGYNYAGGVYEHSVLLFLADRSDGARVLLCANEENNDGYIFIESTPLPQGTTFGIENFENVLNLGGKGYGVSVVPFSDHTWGAHVVLTPEHNFFVLGQNWIHEELSLAYRFGDHPWKDITRMDWSTIPKNFEEACGTFDSSDWATPRNPNPEDRLHLRKRPDRTSTSLGKFYNGTPVRILEHNADWTKVQLGSREGWMMTRYLAFAEEAQSVSPAISGIASLRPVVQIIWDLPDRLPQNLPCWQISGFLLTGIDGDYAILWDPVFNAFCRVPLSDIAASKG